MILVQKSDKAAIEIEKQRLDGMAFGEWLELDLSDLGKQITNSFDMLMDVRELQESINALGAEELEKACTHIVTDDSMHPTIPEGAQVKTMLVALESVKDGDFVCFAKDDSDKIYIRQIELLGDNREKMLLKAFNSKGIKSELIETSSGRLYEKVVQVIINFE